MFQSARFLFLRCVTSRALLLGLNIRPVVRDILLCRGLAHSASPGDLYATVNEVISYHKKDFFSAFRFPALFCIPAQTLISLLHFFMSSSFNDQRSTQHTAVTASTLVARTSHGVSHCGVFGLRDKREERGSGRALDEEEKRGGARSQRVQPQPVLEPPCGTQNGADSGPGLSSAAKRRNRRHRRGHANSASHKAPQKEAVAVGDEATGTLKSTTTEPAQRSENLGLPLAGKKRGTQKIPKKHTSDEQTGTVTTDRLQKESRYRGHGRRVTQPEGSELLGKKGFASFSTNRSGQLYQQSISCYHTASATRDWKIEDGSVSSRFESDGLTAVSKNPSAAAQNQSSIPLPDCPRQEWISQVVDHIYKVAPNVLCHIRKQHICPEANESIVSCNGGFRVTIQWSVPSVYVTHPSVSPTSSTTTVMGVGFDRGKESARKAAVVDVLKALTPPTMGELSEVLGWLIGQEKGLRGGTTTDTVQKARDGSTCAEVVWSYKDGALEHSQSSQLVGSVKAASADEALARARAYLLFKLHQVPVPSRDGSAVGSSPSVALEKKSAVGTVKDPELPSGSPADPESSAEIVMCSSKSSDLNASEASEIMQRSQLLLTRLGIEEKFSYRQCCINGRSGQVTGHGCDIEWAFTDEKGCPRVARATAVAQNRKAARALARVTLLKQLGVEESMSTWERQAARSIRHLMTTGKVDAAVEEGIRLLSASESSVDSWSLVLPSLWRATLASYDLRNLHNILMALRTASVPASGRPAREVPVHLWDQLLDACCILNNTRVGYSGVAMLTGGSSYNAVDRLDPVAGFDIALERAAFPSDETRRLYQHYRAMLAYEFRAEVTHRIASGRMVDELSYSGLDTGGTLASPSSGGSAVEDKKLGADFSAYGFNTPLSRLDLRVVQNGPDFLKLRTTVTPDADRFLQQSNLRENDLALIKPSTPSESVTHTKSGSSASVCVVRISTLTVKDGVLDLTLRLATDEALGQILRSHFFSLYALTTSISSERMVAALKTLCLSRWSHSEKRPVMHFSTSLRYILLNPLHPEAKLVARDAPVPQDFLDVLESNDMAGAMADRRAKKPAGATFGDTRGLLQPSSALLESPHLDVLTHQQQQAVIWALKNRLTLIQGPPGTGKTFVACTIIRLWHEANPRLKILAVADSNVAADNLSDGLTRMGIESARVGAGSDIDIQDYIKNYNATVSSTVYNTEFSKQKAHKYERMRLFRQLVASRQVVITTCIGSGHPMFEDFQFHRVIIDECAHSTEPASLVPLSRGCESLVLIGDYKQLTATVLSREACERGLSMSLMERLATSGVSDVFLLNVQRRMHPSIAEFPNQQFYEGRLRSADVSDSLRPPIQGLIFPNPAVRVCFVKVKPRRAVTGGGLESSEGSSKMNTAEAQLVVPILQSVLEKYQGLLPEEIGVLTPYIAQKRHIKRVLAARFPPDIVDRLEIDTVDAFQGREKELIIFSAVRSNAQNSVGFLSDDRRMNVMLTRARRGLVVLGDPTTLQADPNWNVWIQWITSRRGAIVSEDLKRYLSHSHPDHRAAEEGIRAVCEGRLVNLWAQRHDAHKEDSATHNTPETKRSSVNQSVASPHIPDASSSAASSFVAHQTQHYMNAIMNGDASDLDDEDWYGDQAAADAAAAALRTRSSCQEEPH